MIGLLVGGPAGAVPPVDGGITVDAATGHVTCDTIAGHFALRALSSRAADGTITARVRLVTPALGERWVPAAGFLFKGSDRRNAGVEIALSPDNQQTMLVGLRLPDHQSGLIQLGAYPANQWIELSVSLDAGGLMTARMADRIVRRRVRLRGPITPVLLCNSGTFAFELSPGTRLVDQSDGRN